MHGKGCSCTRLQAKDNEEAETVTTAIIDLAKAFDKVELRVAWELCVASQFPADLLGTIFSYFVMERRLCVDGCFGTPLLTTSAILSGSKWSCMILKAVMLQPMDGLQARFPEPRQYGRPRVIQRHLRTPTKG